MVGLLRLLDAAWSWDWSCSCPGSSAPAGAAPPTPAAAHAWRPATARRPRACSGSGRQVALGAQRASRCCRRRPGWPGPARPPWSGGWPTCCSPAPPRWRGEPLNNVASGYWKRISSTTAWSSERQADRHRQRGGSGPRSKRIDRPPRAGRRGQGSGEESKRTNRLRERGFAYCMQAAGHCHLRGPLGGQRRGYSARKLSSEQIDVRDRRG